MGNHPSEGWFERNPRAEMACYRCGAKNAPQYGKDIFDDNRHG